jgi:hypothetical protein
MCAPQKKRRDVKGDQRAAGRRCPGIIDFTADNDCEVVHINVEALPAAD